MSKNWYMCTLHNTKVGYQITFLVPHFHHCNVTDIRVMQYVTDTRENDYTSPSDEFLLGVIIFDAEVGISR